MLSFYWFRLKSYLSYQFRAVGSHSLHSPFLFDLYNKAIKPSRNFRLETVEKCRAELLHNHEVIDLFDLKTKSNYKKTISSIARTSLSTPKFSAFLYHLITYLQTKTVLESGTSLGINSLYMAGPDQVNEMVTIEASPIIASIASKQFSKVFQRKISIKQGTIQNVFETTVVKFKPDFCFIDADHRGEAVRTCIEVLVDHCPSIKCIVIHDIYWSEDMLKEWHRVKNDPRFNLTVDLFQAGLIFPSIQMPKQHFTLRF